MALDEDAYDCTDTGYETLVAFIAHAPKTMLPEILKAATVACVKANVFINPGAMTSFFANAKREAEREERERVALLAILGTQQPEPTPDQTPK